MDPGVTRCKEPELFCWVAFLAIVFLGPGEHSIDAELQDRKKSKTGI